MIIRDATEADLQSCTAVWASTQANIGSDPIPHQPLSPHELNTGRLTVADVDGEVIGFGGTLTRSGVLYLVDLFVRPVHQSKGVGRQLLQSLCVDHHGPLFTFASTDPRAQHLYEQYGMHAVENYHYLEARGDGFVPWATDVDLVAASRAEILAIDAEITGRERSADIDYALDLQAVWYLASRGPVVVGAVAVVAPTWWNPWHPRGARVGPVLAHDPVDVGPTIAAALAVAATLDVDSVAMFAPTGLDALPALTSAGFEVIDTDLLMASDPTLFDRGRYLPTVDTP